MSTNISTNRVWILFRSNFLISAFTFGGGTVIIPMLQKKYVEELQWIDGDEMMEMVAIAQSSPGVMAVNTAIMIGYRSAGVGGALASILGSILPPMLILSIISYAYEAFSRNQIVALLLRGMEAGVAAVVIDVSIKMSGNVLKHKNLLNNILLIGAAAAAIVFGVPIINLIALCGVVSLIAALVSGHRERKGMA